MQRYNDVNEAYRDLLSSSNSWEVMNSRNGKVKSSPSPILMEFSSPRKRVLFDVARKANPFFHVAEAIWMLAGRNDVDYPRQFNSQMYVYSDDGKSFNAAYGFRWKHHFGVDQVAKCVEMLRANPEDRRVVMSMWDPRQDLGSKSLDIPCNLQIMFRVVGGELVMTTTNRSNDLIWGLLGANCVHLSFLHEYIAAAVDLPLGKWYHMTNNLHIYEHHWDLANRMSPACQYPSTMPLVHSPNIFIPECARVVDMDWNNVREPFLRETVIPMLRAWSNHKSGLQERAMDSALSIEAEDWRVAACQWLKVTYEK